MSSVVRRIIAVILALAACGGLFAALAPAAFADGDPASDVLPFFDVFDPPDTPGATSVQAQELKAEVAAMNRAGYPLKVAIIASSADLGTANEFWEDAGDYAQHYLGLELSDIYHGNLLVVMPQTDGLYVPVAPSKIPHGDELAMEDLAPAGSDLIGSTIDIVRKLASDNRIPLPRVFGVSEPPAPAASSPLVPLIGFVIGLLVLLGVWGASLRRMPLRLPNRRVAA